MKTITITKDQFNDAIWLEITEANPQIKSKDQPLGDYDTGLVTFAGLIRNRLFGED